MSLGLKIICSLLHQLIGSVAANWKCPLLEVAIFYRCNASKLRDICTPQIGLSSTKDFYFHKYRSFPSVITNHLMNIKFSILCERFLNHLPWRKQWSRLLFSKFSLLASFASFKAIFKSSYVSFSKFLNFDIFSVPRNGSNCVF